MNLHNIRLILTQYFPADRYTEFEGGYLFSNGCDAGYLKEAGCSTMDLFYGFEFRTQ
jgi:hypothetical protein